MFCSSIFNGLGVLKQKVKKEELHLVAERLSATQIILHRISRRVCIYLCMYICMYVSMCHA